MAKLIKKKDVEKLFWTIVLLPLILTIIFFKIIFGKKLTKRVSKKDYLSKDVKDLSPQEFEHYISQLFKKRGYKTKVTNYSGDYGVDIIAKNKEETLAIQVKKYENTSVGNQAVQRLLGAMQMKKFNATKAILITTSRFTKKAYEQARDCPIELWDNKKLSKVIKSVKAKYAP